MTEATVTGDAPFGRRVARFDDRVDAVLDRWRGRRGLDRVFETASQLGDWSVIWHLAGASRGLLDHDESAAIQLSVVLGAESLIVNQGVKRLFGRGRPRVGTTRNRLNRLRNPTTSSFPSGHASAAFCAAVLLSAGHRRQAPLWFLLAAIVATSRVYVKLHHASDVVAGALLGLLIGWGARSTMRRRSPR